MLVVGLPSGAQLATALARELGCEASQLETHTFPDGETLVRFDRSVAGRTVILAGSLHQPDTKTLPILFAADAARELGAKQVGLVAPYLAYMRQDHRFRDGEAITSRSYARLLSSCLDFLVTVDPHLHRWHSLGDIYAIRTQVVPSAAAIAQWVTRNVQDPLLVGPDSESEQWVSDVARRAAAPWTVMSKTRHGDRQVGVQLLDEGPWPGRTPVIVDDIISTGHTLAAAAQALKAKGLPSPICIGVHALCDDAALALLHRAGFSRVVTCNTVPHPTNAIALEPALADAVRSLTQP